MLAILKSRWQHHHQLGTAVPKEFPLHEVTKHSLCWTLEKVAPPSTEILAAGREFDILHHLVKCQTSAGHERALGIPIPPFASSHEDLESMPRHQTRPPPPIPALWRREQLSTAANCLPFLVDAIFPLTSSGCVFTAHVCKDEGLEEP